MRRRHLDVGEERRVVAGSDPPEVRSKETRERPASRRQLARVSRIGEEPDPLGLQDRRFGRQASRLLERVREPPRRDLAGLDVGLVERIDPQDRAGDGRRELPAEELRPDLVRRGDLDPDHGLPGRLEARHRAVLGGVRRRVEPQVDEQAVPAIELRGAEGLAVDRDEALARLPGRLGQELLEPGPEIVDPRRGDQRDLVAPPAPEHAQDGPEHRAGIVLGTPPGPAGARHRLRRAEQPRDVEPHEGRGDHAEVGERRVAPADRREPEAHVTEAVRPGDLLELRAGIRDRDEPVARPAGADGLLHPLEEVLLEDVRLEGRARLGRHDEQRSPEIHPRLARPDLGRVRRVQHGELGPSGERPEGHAEDLGAEARASHPEKQDVGEARLPDVLGDAPELAHPPDLLVDDPEPSEPARLVGARPEGGVARPEPPDLALLAPLAERGRDRGLEIRRQGPGPRVRHVDSPCYARPAGEV